MRKVILLISMEVGLAFGAVVVSVMTPLVPLWVWATGAGVFSVLIPLVLYYPEWMTFLRQTRRRVYSRALQYLRIQPASENAVSPPDDGLGHFRACRQDIRRCRELIEPFAAPLGRVELGLQALTTDSDQLLELLLELQYLGQRLDALSIQYPSVYGPDGESDTALHVRLRLWSSWLRDLEVMTGHDDLKRARLYPPVGAVMPLTDHKSDAQC